MTRRSFIPPSALFRGRGRVFALAAAVLAFLPLLSSGSGALAPWTRYEAEDTTVNGGILGPYYGAGVVGTEASGRKYAQLNLAGQYVQFTAQAAANAIVVRYSIPDSANGTGLDSTLSLYTNSVYAGKLPLTSRYSWLYGSYSFTNYPPAGSPRNFFDEARSTGLSIRPGDVVRLQKDASDTASSYIIDLVELENVPPPLAQPPNSLSVVDFGAAADGLTDDTAAVTSCIAAAATQGKCVWLPAGTYRITSFINVPPNLTIQGAGMWHTVLTGDANLYGTPSRRVALSGTGSNIHLSDFAIAGKLTYRKDSEPNDGLVGSYGTGSTISRIWVEHTKTGAWVVNSRELIVDSCRFRNTLADGLNLCVGTQGCIVTNCSARGTGDDCFAVWPANYTSQTYAPGSNLITHCTAECPFLANGAALYGGAGNRIEDSRFQDMPYGCGVLISTTFAVAATFSGITEARRCDLNRCGGYDAGYGWRGAVQVCMDKYNGISGLRLAALNISNSVSDGLSVIGNAGALAGATAANVNIPNFGIGAGGRHALWAGPNTSGSLTVSNCVIVEFRNDSAGFTFNFVTSTIPVTVQSSPAGCSFSVDGLSYQSAHTFNWLSGSSHAIGTTSPQSAGSGTQYAWRAWSDGGAISHTVTPTTNSTYTAEFTTQYFLNMNPGPGGTVSPGSLWTNSGSAVLISATASNGYSFDGWTGTGSGSYSGGNSDALVTLEGPITQAATFSVIPTRILYLGGVLAFGAVMVGSSSNLSLTVSNAGNATLTVSRIDYPQGFSGPWSGVLLPNQGTNLTVTFSPTEATSYGGWLTVVSDANGGNDHVEISGTGSVNPFPPAQRILRIAVSAGSSATISYQTEPGYPYHVETTTNLSLPNWAVATGSATNATGNSVTFTDPNPPTNQTVYYRTASP